MSFSAGLFLILTSGYAAKSCPNRVFQAKKRCFSSSFFSRGFVFSDPEGLHELVPTTRELVGTPRKDSVARHRFPNSYRGEPAPAEVEIPLRPHPHLRPTESSIDLSKPCCSQIRLLFSNTINKGLSHRSLVKELAKSVEFGCQVADHYISLLCIRNFISENGCLGSHFKLSREFAENIWTCSVYRELTR